MNGGIGYHQGFVRSARTECAISLSFRLPLGDNYNDAGTGSRVVRHDAGALCRTDPFGSPGSRGTGVDSHGIGPLAQRRSRDDGLSLCGRCGGTVVLLLRVVLAGLRRGAGSRSHGGRQSMELDWSGAVLSSRSTAGRIASGADRVAGDVQRGDCGVDPTGRRQRPVAIGRQLRIHRSFGRLDVSFICALGLGRGLAGSTRRQCRLGLRLSGCGRRGRHTGGGRPYGSFDCLDSGSPPWKIRRGRHAVSYPGPQRGAGPLRLFSNLVGVDWPEWQR